MKQSLSLLTMATIVSSSLIAEQASLEQPTEAKLVITANRSTQLLDDTLASVEVLDQDDIARLNPISVSQLLKSFGGLDITNSGGHGQAASIYTRGGNSDHTLILIDGVRVGSATLGVKEINAIPVALIERVEFVKGPRAALWGSDAISGVIQIFTRRLNHNEYQLGSTIGSHGAKHGHLAYGFGNERVKNTITLASEHADGFDVLESAEPDDDGYRRISAAFKGDYRLSDNLALDWSLRHSQGNSEYDNAYGEINESDYDNTVLNIRYVYDDAKWNSELAVKHSKDDSVNYGGSVTQEMGDVFATERNQISARFGRKLDEHWLLAGGLDWFEDKVGESTTPYSTNERYTNSAYISNLYKNERFLSEITVRLDEVENVDDETSYNVSFGYRVSSDWLVSITQAEAFKAPTFNDLYYPAGLYSSGNPLLLPEYATSTELNLKHSFDSGRVTISVYNNDVDNLIDWQPDANFFYQPYNVASATIEGVDVQVQANALGLNHVLNMTYVEALDNATGEQLNRRAREFAEYQINGQYDQLGWFSHLRYTGTRRDGTVTLPSYTTLDLGVEYAFSQKLSAQLTLNNALDSKQQTLNNYRPIEREIYFTLTYQNF